MKSKFALRLSCLLALLACDDLEAPNDDGVQDASVPVPVDPTDDSAPHALVVDASRDDVWAYLDFETGAVQTAATEPAGFAWDVALQRFKVKLNAPVSAAGSARASVIVGADFAALSQAPLTGYGSDLPDGDDTDLEPDYFISTGTTGWWDYDPMTHKLSPRAHVYVVRSTEGAYFKLAISNYYNAAGSPGYPNVQWGKLAPPPGTIEERDAAVEPLDATTSASKAAPWATTLGIDAGR